MPGENSEGNLTSRAESLAHNLLARQSSEAMLRAARARLTAIIESLPFDVFVIDTEGRYVLTNSTCRKHWGEIIGKRPDDVAGDERTAALWRNNNARALAGEVIRDEVSFPIKGELRHFYNLIAPVYEDGTVSGILGVNLDITEYKRVEEEKRALERTFSEAQRLHSVGALAGGIAHDFNNRLMAIQGHASLLLLLTPESDPRREHLLNIEQHVRSGARLTRQLLGLARGGSRNVAPTDLNELVRENAALFARTRKDIKVEGRYEPRLWTAAVDRGQIEQVLMNLFLNAGYAMPEGGRLAIRTENAELDHAAAARHGIGAGRYVELSVSDTGAGIDAEVLPHIFEPFFTTKECGKGTGLGLASAYGIVKNHGGAIEVTNRPDVSTTLTVFLPATDAVPAPAAPAPAGPAAGQGRILVVDDDRMIADVTAAMLRRLGYDVLVATTGREAIEQFEARADGIDAVVLDAIMSDTCGGEIYETLREIDPGVRVLLSSGYDPSGRVGEILERGCRAFLQKPYTIRELSAKLQELLAED